MRLLIDKIITYLKQIKYTMLCIINCHNVVIKIHTTKIIEGKANKNTTQGFGGNKYSKKTIMK